MSRPFQHRIKKQVEPRSDYGGRIGAPPGTMFTMDFKDSDRDGVDDRHQPGPGMPDPRWKGRKPAPPRREGPKFGDRNDPRRDRLEKALQDRKRRDLLTGGKRPPRGGGGDMGFHPLPSPRPPIGGGRPPRGGGWSPKPPRKGRTVKGSRPRPPMPSPRPPRRGDFPPMRLFGGGIR